MSLPEPPQFTFSEKQKKQLVVDNHTFNNNQIRPNGCIYWTCTERRSIKDGKIVNGCKSSCTTREGRLLKKPSPHNHEPKHTPESIELNQNLKAQIKKRARTDKKTPIPQLFKEELAKLKANTNIEITEQNASLIKSLKSYSNSLYKERNKKNDIDEQAAKRPKLNEEINLENQDTINKTIVPDKPPLLNEKDENNQRPIGFESSNKIIILTHCDKLHMDEEMHQNYRDLKEDNKKLLIILNKSIKAIDTLITENNKLKSILAKNNHKASNSNGSSISIGNIIQTPNNSKLVPSTSCTNGPLNKPQQNEKSNIQTYLNVASIAVNNQTVKQTNGQISTPMSKQSLITQPISILPINRELNKENFDSSNPAVANFGIENESIFILD